MVVAAKRSRPHRKRARTPSGGDRDPNEAWGARGGGAAGARGRVLVEGGGGGDALAPALGGEVKPPRRRAVAAPGHLLSSGRQLVYHCHPERCCRGHKHGSQPAVGPAAE